MCIIPRIFLLLISIGSNIFQQRLKTIILSIILRDEYNLSFFESHHAATALENDGKIISKDQQYNRVSNLELLDPDDFLNQNLSI